MDHTLYAPRIYTPTGFTRTPLPDGVRALDVGCGGRKLPGSDGMDVLALPGVDVVHNMDMFPWPIQDQTYDLVFMNHALEHAQQVISVLDEAHRVLKPGGRLVIQVPYFRSVDAFNDPTHTHFFTSGSLDYVIAGTGLHAYAYARGTYTMRGFWYGWPHPSRNPLVEAFKKFIHAHKAWYDQYLSLLKPVECVTWELEKV